MAAGPTLTTSFSLALPALLCEEGFVITPTLQMGKLRHGNFRNVPVASSPAVIRSLPQAAAGLVSLLRFIVVITVITYGFMEAMRAGSLSSDTCSQCPVSLS